MRGEGQGRSYGPEKGLQSSYQGLRVGPQRSRGHQQTTSTLSGYLSYTSAAWTLGGVGDTQEQQVWQQ